MLTTLNPKTSKPKTLRNNCNDLSDLSILRGLRNTVVAQPGLLGVMIV